MSSASKPLGMNSMPASGYNHKSTTYNKQYIPWKGTGLNSFPVGTAPGHIRPLTNNDPGNNFQTGFGLARPIKHYRKGRVIPVYLSENTVSNLNKNSPYSDINLNINQQALINYNMNPIIKNKGSAIFIHLATRNYSPTSGCIGLNKKNMIELIKKLKKNEFIKIL